ncbi:MAG: SulP family inorganic anion transporter [Casimicrobiaceae bacterium]
MPPLGLKLFPFLAWRDRVTRATLRADLLAGLIGALVVLPQGVAYATLAGMPPQYGLYCAMLPVVVAALWGSSWHQISGPTNALSLVVFATMAPLAAPGSESYIELVLTLALLVGLLQFGMGVARLGALVNFISHTVVIGFTAGAGLLIIAAQLNNFFGVPVPPGIGFFATLKTFVQHLAQLDPWITLTGATTLVVAIVAKRFLRRIPYMIVAMIAGSLVGYALVTSGTANVPAVGALPSGIPSLSLPSFDPETWRRIFPAALALTVLGLTEAVSIARAVAVKSGQRIDGNQEFIGQGLSNIVGAFSSAYPSSGSFNRSGVNFEAGAQTPLAAVFSAALLFVVLLGVAPLAAYLPLAVMAGLLFVVAWGLIDVAQMRRIARTNRGDALVLAVTFLSTLAIQLEFAIFVGVLASLLVYLHRTTHPHLTPVVPDPTSAQRHFAPASNASAVCPQLLMLRVDGSLFFGAVEHVRDELHEARERAPDQRHILLIGSGINFIDVAGAELLVQEARLVRESGGTLYLCNLKPAVRTVLERGGFLDLIGRDCVFATKDDAIRAIYVRLDSSRCRTCDARIFGECQSVPPDGSMRVA